MPLSRFHHNLLRWLFAKELHQTTADVTPSVTTSVRRPVKPEVRQKLETLKERAGRKGAQ